MLDTSVPYDYKDGPIVDGFTHSLSTLMLPTTYRASALAQMETLRRATNYQFKMYSSPDEANATIPAFSQNEYLWKLRPGTYVWGMYMGYQGEAPDFTKIYAQVVDMSTGMPFISDYEIAAMLAGTLNSGNRVYKRYPFLLPGPRLVSGSGNLTAEVYNSSASPATVQLVIYCAEPIAEPDPCADPSQPCSQD